MPPIAILFIFGGIAIISIVLFSVLGLFVALAVDGAISLESIQNLLDIGASKNKQSLMIMQSIASFGGFVFPVWLTSKLFEGYQINVLAPLKKFDWRLLLIIPLILFGMQSLIDLLHQLNKLFPFSESFLAKEKANLSIQELFIKGNGIKDLLIILVVVALIPAIAEELFFRGALLQIFQKMNVKGMHLNVFLQALVFGLIHMNATQMLPIIAIGMLLGYLAIYSKSIIYGIVLHFLNNGMAVAMVFYKNEIEQINYLNRNTMFWYEYMIGILILGLAAFLFYKRSQKITTNYA